jgi:folate-binding Fe-S cluster repair protein YgfZ
MHAVSFNKGCYIGQEIVERIRAQGRINKKIVRVEADAAAPLAPGTKLTAEGAEAGEITSSVWSPRFGKVVGLAFVRAQHVENATTLQAGDVSVRVVA